MEFCFGSDIEHLVVPRDEEMFDGLPSPYSLFPWGKATFGSFNSSMKSSIAGVEELLLSGTTFSPEVDQVYSSSACMGPPHDSCQWGTYPHKHSDFHLNDFARFDEADDIFFHSLLEDNGSGINAVGSVNCSSTPSRANVMPSNLSRDLSSESDTVQCHINNTGNSKDLKRYAFPASSDCENEAHDEPFLLEKEMVVDIPFSLKHISGDEQITDETSFEESVYLELRSLMVQLTDNTRICLRDALYRLAAKHEETDHIEDGNEAPEECSPRTYSEASRLSDTEAEESTNAIDRTVANLLFNTSFCSHTSTEGEDELRCSFHNSNPCLSTSSHAVVSDGDGKVPNHLLPTPTDYAHFSPTAADLLSSEAKLGHERSRSVFFDQNA